MNHIKATIFDLDGLLLDTERIALSTFVAACREHDFEPDINVYYKCLGRNESTTKQIMLDGYGKDFPWESINELWVKEYDKETLGKAIPIKAGALSLLEYLEEGTFKKVVATSSRTAKAREKLSRAGMLHFFDFVLGGDEITNPKPHPEIYLSACRRLNEEPANCLALEDSENGVRSALEAGLTVIQVPDLVPPSRDMQALGHKIVKSLVEVKMLLQNHKSGGQK
ncbi:MAG: HAD family phosphatase [Chloroflexi bacterium]|nr:HAD family phosphatase [Chloroflexota bacterium]